MVKFNPLISILSAFLLAFVIIKPPEVFADCQPADRFCSGLTRCGISDLQKNQCCDLASECNDATAVVVDASGQEDYKVRLCKGDTTGECSGCLNRGGIYTAFGCFTGDADEFTSQILKFAVGIAGGVSFLMLIYGAFLYTISAGDPKALDNAKGTISGALTGLIFIIFSVILLNMIGFQILQLPGF